MVQTQQSKLARRHLGVGTGRPSGGCFVAKGFQEKVVEDPGIHAEAGNIFVGNRGPSRGEYRWRHVDMRIMGGKKVEGPRHDLFTFGV